MRLYLLLGSALLGCSGAPSSEPQNCEPQCPSATSTTGGNPTSATAASTGGTSLTSVTATSAGNTSSTTSGGSVTSAVTATATSTTGTTGNAATSTTSGGSGGTGGATSTSAGDTSATGGGSGGSTNEWHGEVTSVVTEESLSTEYATWKERHVETCSDGSSVVVKDGAVVSEGIAYGMLLAANFDDRALFDGLWQYYGDHVDANGLMNWATSLCESAGDNGANAATDAELDAAMALVQAHARWPDGGYLAFAEDLAGRILSHETDVCDGELVLLPGDAWGGCNDTDTRINPSYFAPGYYRVFAAKFAAQAEQWNQLLEKSHALYASYQAMFPLVPDWDNHPYGDEASLDHYNYDACRTPWRVATDYAWSGDSRSSAFLENVASWVDGNGGIGSPGGKANNSAFNGAFALSGVTDAAKLDAYVSAWLSSGGDDGPYFQGTLRVLYLLVAAGRFPSTL